jgi:putative ABC transport system permease protein
MTNFLQDIQFGFRMLLKSRGLAAIAIFALALGIGANTAIFSVVNTVLLRAFPYPQPDHLVWFWESQPNLEQAPFSADFLDYQAQNQSFQRVATIRRLSFNLSGQGIAERIPGWSPPQRFSLLGVHPILRPRLSPRGGRIRRAAPRASLVRFLAKPLCR